MRRPITRFLLFFSPISFIFAQYRPIEIPGEWTFAIPTQAYSVETPHEKLGKFQPGITVEVEAVDPQSEHWHVVFKRYGSPDIHSYIDPPNLAINDPVAFNQVADLINAFPIMKELLEATTPWPQSPQSLGRMLFNTDAEFDLISGTEEAPTKLKLHEIDASTKAWNYTPLSVVVDYSIPSNKQINIELWNKGDAYLSGLDPSRAHQKLKANLQEIQGVFRSYLKDPKRNNPANMITAVRQKEDVFLLPNDLRVSLRYANGEYLIISFESISQLSQAPARSYTPETFSKQIAEQVVEAESGHIYIQNIPMIDQGRKGYCAAASLARVLQFYGYAVDQHSMAELAETEAQITPYDRGGTQREDILDAIRRISNSTPFRLSKIKKAHPNSISEIIEKGIPIIWFIPGHARLLIGIHPENNEIVFSDSWGSEYQFETATWDYFRNTNQEMWFLEPRE